MFRAIISPILRSTRLCLQLVVQYFQVTGQQHHRCIVPQAVNTTKCSWGRTKLSPETCWADWNHQYTVIVASSWLFISLYQWCTVTLTSNSSQGSQGPDNETFAEIGFTHSTAQPQIYVRYSFNQYTNKCTYTHLMI